MPLGRVVHDMPDQNEAEISLFSLFVWITKLKDKDGDWTEASCFFSSFSFPFICDCKDTLIAKQTASPAK